MVRVSVIGAGAAGLVATHELRLEGHEATVFEQSDRLGGLWNYTDEVEDDPLGQRPTRRVHTSLYESLEVNLPRDLMAFEGYTFDSAGGGDDRWPRYPHHRRVLEYLQRFAMDTGVVEAVRFGHAVERVERSSSRADWLVDGEAFDAIAVCNGHFSEPYVPELPGLEDFPGVALHSHNYRRPDAFAGSRIVVLGTSVSGGDLTREIAGVAEVFFSGRLFEQSRPLAEQSGPIRRCPPISRLDGGDAVLANGERITRVDAIVFCTGYRYRFPFLPPDLAPVGDNRVMGLYRQLVAVEEPSLAFVGLPVRIVPFPLFQRQARWFARALARRFPLPSLAERRRDHDDEISRLRGAGVAERHFHRLDDGQFGYLNQLAAECGDEPVPDWFVALWREHHANALKHTRDYRRRPLTWGGPTVIAS
ncbi:MAG: NAD(P)-binding protein [Gammaproteobacteria bacterium]|nr:NAD(P)-binding protein [Gammaproteobacteria bacterium]